MAQTAPNARPSQPSTTIWHRRLAAPPAVISRKACRTCSARVKRRSRVLPCPGAPGRVPAGAPPSYCSGCPHDRDVREARSVWLLRTGPASRSAGELIRRAVAAAARVSAQTATPSISSYRWFGQRASLQRQWVGPSLVVAQPGFRWVSRPLPIANRAAACGARSAPPLHLGTGGDVPPVPSAGVGASSPLAPYAEVVPARRRRSSAAMRDSHPLAARTGA